MSSPPSTIWAVCREGFRRNRVPALVLQAFAGILLCLYFTVLPVQQVPLFNLVLCFFSLLLAFVSR